MLLSAGIGPAWHIETREAPQYCGASFLRRYSPRQLHFGAQWPQVIARVEREYRRMLSLQRPLSATLSQLLIAYTVDFDAALAEAFRSHAEGTPPSLAMWANVLRFVGERGVASQRLPMLSGIARPTIKTMLACLQRHGWIEIDSQGTVQLTERGAVAQRVYSEAHEAVLRRWRDVCGTETFEMLRNALEGVANRLGREFPEYPMPAPHRGAYPTGE